MASQTLAEAGKLIQDDLVRGVAQDIITVNPIFERLPFEQFTGQAIVVNRENALGDAGFYAVNSTITHKTAATYTQATYSPTSIIGDAEVNGLVQATSESDGVDQMGLEISSKSKNIGRLYQQGMATGDGSAPNMNSLHTLVDSSQYTTASATQALSFALLDELLDLVTIKNGQVDFIMMHRRTMRSFRALVRALGGVDANTIVAFEGTQQEQKVLTYSGVPVYRNDYLSIVETANGGAVNWRSVGFCLCRML